MEERQIWGREGWMEGEEGMEEDKGWKKERKGGMDGWMDGGGDGRRGMGSEGKEDHKIGWVLPCLCVKTSSNILWVGGGGGQGRQNISRVLT